MTFDIERDPENDMVLVYIMLDQRWQLRALLDTGASHTTLDSNELYMAGYDLTKKFGSSPVETANGVILIEHYKIREFATLGIARKNLTVQVYDFLAHGMASNYQAVLGMDFFKGTKFCIDTVRNQISIELNPV